MVWRPLRSASYFALMGQRRDIEVACESVHRVHIRDERHHTADGMRQRNSVAVG